MLDADETFELKGGIVLKRIGYPNIGDFKYNKCKSCTLSRIICGIGLDNIDEMVDMVDNNIRRLTIEYESVCGINSDDSGSIFTITKN